MHIKFSTLSLVCSEYNIFTTEKKEKNLTSVYLLHFRIHSAETLLHELDNISHSI